MDTARRAALVVADRARDAADCQLLLEMLGLADVEAASVPSEQPKRRGRKPKDHGHGHPATYARGCRCPVCKKTNTARCTAWRRAAQADPAAADRAGHGKASTYNNHGCRCPACRRAQSERNAQYRAARANQQKAAAA